MSRMRIHINLIYLLFLFSIGSTLPANDFLHLADSLYLKHRYSEALPYYQNLLENDHYLKQNIELNFKMAVCLARNNQLDPASEIFNRLKQSTHLLDEYVDYFLFLIALRQENNVLVERISTDFLNRYSSHFLADSVLFHLADYEFGHQQYSSALDHYLVLSGKKPYTAYRPFFQIRMALSKLYLGEEDNAHDRMYQIMKLYPESPEALEITKRFENTESLEEKLLFTMAEVYLQHNQYSVLTEKLEKFIIRTRDPALKEKARFYLIQIYYDRGQYQTALYGFKNLLEGLKNAVLEPRICLMLARCYLYVGKKEEAAKKYLEYAKLFPRRRIATESIWKAGWIYEDLGNLPAAEMLYQDLIKQWPKSEFAWDARFRIGLNHYRLNHFSRAILTFQEITKNQESIFQQHRGWYWLAKTYLKQGRRKEADSLFMELGKGLFDSYYAVKSYYLYQEQVDSLMNLQENLASTDNPLKAYSESINLWLEDFEKVFMIREVLGDDFALQEISENYHQPGSLKEWVALAEIYKRFGAFNRSFRIYDYVNQKYFAAMPFINKPFILKEYYPLYYDHLIQDYCTRRNLNKNLILAIIREESNYDRQAHSYANAYGLMQIIPGTASEIADDLGIHFSRPENLYDAELNINMGTYYLRKLLNHYDDTIEYALAAYNAGPHRVNRWMKIDFDDEMDIFIENIEFQQTRNYVRRVMKNYLVYKILDNVRY